MAERRQRVWYDPGFKAWQAAVSKCVGNHVRPQAPFNFIVIGAGSRGNAYASALYQSTPEARIIAVAEPVPSKRDAFGEAYIWGKSVEASGQYFEGWKQLVAFCIADRRLRLEQDRPSLQVDGVFICTMDDTHAEIIKRLAPLGYHIMSEKPLATTLADCLGIHRSLQPRGTRSPKQLFSVGHVLRYSPHNMMLRKLLWEDEIIGDIISVEHTEPVGWWHFAHSYVRGNWRKESTTAPSLLTKSCHDIDLLLWLMCTPPKAASTQRPHLPREVSSTGSLLYFKKQRKPESAGAATNCYQCPAEEKDCIYSAKKIYLRDQLHRARGGWPITAIDSDIEDMYVHGEEDSAWQRLEDRLKEDYLERDSEAASQRSWYGRCVFEAHNDVCDDQIVTMSWEDDPLSLMECRDMPKRLHGRGAKNASFHMVASTEKQCERRGRIYGARGEIEYDSQKIRVYDFATKKVTAYHPPSAGGGHGGGDSGLAMAFFNAVKAVKQGTLVEQAQQEHIGCTLTDIVRSHAMVFAAEEARRQKKVVNWATWWQENVATYLFTNSAYQDTMAPQTEPK